MLLYCVMMHVHHTICMHIMCACKHTLVYACMAVLLLLWASLMCLTVVWCGLHGLIGTRIVSRFKF